MYDADYADISLSSNISNNTNIFSSIHDAWNYIRADLINQNRLSNNATWSVNGTILTSETSKNYEIILLSNLTITQGTNMNINMSLNSSLEITISCDKSYLYEWSNMSIPSNINQWCHLYHYSSSFITINYSQEKDVTVTLQST